MEVSDGEEKPLPGLPENNAEEKPEGRNMYQNKITP